MLAKLARCGPSLDRRRAKLTDIGQSRAHLHSGRFHTKLGYSAKVLLISAKCGRQPHLDRCRLGSAEFDLISADVAQIGAEFGHKLVEIGQLRSNSRATFGRVRARFGHAMNSGVRCRRYPRKTHCSADVAAPPISISTELAPMSILFRNFDDATRRVCVHTGLSLVFLAFRETKVVKRGHRESSSRLVGNSGPVLTTTLLTS